MGTIFPGHDLSGRWRSKRHPFFALAGIRENGHEEAGSRRQTLARAQEHINYAARRPRAITKDRFHRDVILHVKHRTCLSDSGLARIQFHLYKLHVTSEYFVIHFVHWRHIVSSLVPYYSSCRGAL
jgi:hypothetical protein